MKTEVSYSGLGNYGGYNKFNFFVKYHNHPMIVISTSGKKCKECNKWKIEPEVFTIGLTRQQAFEVEKHLGTVKDIKDYDNQIAKGKREG